jgi:hypothetical protein
MIVTLRLCHKCDIKRQVGITESQVIGLRPCCARTPDKDEFMNLLTNVRPTAL